MGTPSAQQSSRSWGAWWSRPSVWAGLAALALVPIYFVNLHAAGPWDPWETHYGEVARQIVVRSDPLDLWWQPGNGGPDAEAERSFASKPALPFWLMALGMFVFGVGNGPDPAEMVRSPWPELALRLPGMLAGFAAAALLGHAIARLVSPRAGVITAVVLSTMPQWAIVTRQALTDMYFVAPVVLAAVAWAMAFWQDDRPLATRGRGWREIPWDRAYAAFFALFVLAVVAPLAILHQHSFDPLAWRMYGNTPRAAGLHAIQRHMFIYWALAIVAMAASLRFRTRSQVWMGVLYLGAGLSMMGKGMIGPGLVGVLVLAQLWQSGRWSLLRRSGLVLGTVLFVLACFPWHHAMALYRGERWVNELIIQNNLQRFGTGEQKQAVGGLGFYLETLGLAALPWSAIVPLALASGIAAFGWFAPHGEDTPVEARDRATPMLRYATTWFVVTLFVISYSTTKYYHYLLPCLPPLAAMIGIDIDRRLANRGRPFVFGAMIGVAILAGVVRDAIHTPTWIAHLTTYLYTGMWTQGAPSTTRLVLTCLPFALGLVLACIGRLRVAVAAWVLSGALTTTYVLADYLPATSENWSQRSALRIYFDERGPSDRLVSWWFYYRGETFLTKADVWVMKDPDRAALADLFEEYEGRGAALWFITIESHAHRLRSQVPPAYRDRVEEKYLSFHYALLRVQLD